MQKLIEGIHQFQTQIFTERRPLFEGLAAGQDPQALFITCSDSRIDPNLITQTGPGDLFVLRTAGNIVPPYGAVWGGEAGTIEYAIGVLKIRDIIVCGHSHCGAMKGLLHPEELADLRAVREMLKHAEATQRILKGNYMHLTDEAGMLAVAVEENVLVQLENLRTHPYVRAALTRGEVRLHGWVYTFETGEVVAYDSKNGQFLPLDPHSPLLIASAAEASLRPEDRQNPFA